MAGSDTSETITFLALVQRLYDEKQITQDAVEALVSFASIPPQRDRYRTLGEVAYNAGELYTQREHPNMASIPWYRLSQKAAEYWEHIAQKSTR